MSWTEQRMESLTEMWGAGHSAGTIARHLGGVTRNAVIGKVHRMGLPRRKTATRVAKRASRLGLCPTRTQGKPRPSTRQKQWAGQSFRATEAPPTLVIVPKVVAEIAQLQMLRVGTLDLREHMCKWPVGDPKDSAFFFCGCPKANGISYCSHHARLAFQPAGRRRK